MQNAEISTVMQDYKYALDKLPEYDPNRGDTALSLAQLAHQKRSQKRFWSFLSRIF